MKSDSMEGVSNNPIFTHKNNNLSTVMEETNLTIMQGTETTIVPTRGIKPAKETTKIPVTLPRELSQNQKMEGAVFRESLKRMKHVKSERGEILTRPFLDVCKHILPILDKFGPAVKVAKTEIGDNISKLESNYCANETKFNYLFSFVQAEVEMKTAKSSSSCTTALLWLTRSMDFLVVLFRNLHDHHEWTIGQVCSDSYGKTLKPYHGWLASSTFTIAVKLVPERKKFMEVVCSTGDVDADMDKFCTTFQPTLQEIYKFLASLNLDNMKAL